MYKKFLITALLLIPTFSFAVCLSGNYTIGGTSPDYPTFTAAITAAVTDGICGPVTFKVRNGVYTEQFSVPSVPGSNAFNTITFEAEDILSPAVTLQFPASTSSVANYVIEVNNSQFVSFHNLKIYRSGSGTYTRVIAIVNAASNLHFDSNHIQTISGNYTTEDFAAIWCDSTNNSNLIFENNTVTGGSYSLKLSGAIASPETGNIVRYNNFSDVGLSFISAYCQDSPRVYGNTCTQSFSYSAVQGILFTSCSNGIYVDRNKLNSIYAAGIVMRYCVGSAISPLTVTNNAISTTIGPAINVFNSQYADIINNSVFMLNYINGTALSIDVGNNYVRIFNNCLSEGTRVISVIATPPVFSCDYNNFYTTSVNQFRSGSNYYNSLTAWQAATGLDVHSLAAFPQYSGFSNLHIAGNINLESKGFYFSSVPKDLDGQTRSNPPDIGADEFLTPPYDVQLVQVTPASPLCPGSNPVTVKVRNTGMQTLTSFLIGWKINNVPQPGYFWTGALNSGDSIVVTVGSYVFPANQFYNLKAWCYQPNGNTDPTPQNDTLAILNGQTKMSGTYTIGGLSANYATFAAANAALHARGVCGPVTFNVWDGIYIEKLSMSPVPGASQTNRITFQSANHDSTLVSIQYGAASSSYQNYVIELNGADYITFRQISIKRVTISMAYFGTAVSLVNAAVGNTFENDIIAGTSSVSPYYPNSSSTVIYSSNTTTLRNDSTTLRNNVVLGGTYGIFANHGASYPPEYGWRIEHNTLLGQSEMGIGAVDQNNIYISDNTISTINDTLTNATFYGLYIVKCYNGAVISYNTVNHISGTGILVSGCPATVALPGLLSNNTVSNKEVGLAIVNSTNFRFIHNSFNISGTGAASYVFSQVSSSNIYFKNNIFVHSNNGKIFTTTPATALISDYNDFYTTGLFGNSYTTFNAWKLSGHDLHSFFHQPVFVSPTDLHIPLDTVINNAGDSTGITQDMDHATRPGIRPDIGADEFDSIPSYDAGVAHFISPDGITCHGSPRISVWVKNFDTIPVDTIKTFTLYLQINNSMADTVLWHGALAPGDSIAVVADQLYLFQYSQSYFLQAWTQFPNGASDKQPQNDTLSLNAGQVAMGGVYKVGGLEPDFHNFTQAKNALVSLGVCDSVVFDIRAGLYAEQVMFPQIQGSSAQHSITFRSESLDSNSVVLSYTHATSMNDWMVYLNGADYFRFCYLTIGEYDNPAVEYSPIVCIKNGATHNQFRNNVFLGRNNFDIWEQTSQYATIAIRGAGNNHQLIEKNRFVNGIYEVLVDSVPANNMIEDVVIRKNDSYYLHTCLFSINRTDSLVIEDNVIRGIPANGVTLIALNDCDGEVRVTGNRLYGNSPTGITLSNCDGSPSNHILVSNNFYECHDFLGSNLFGINIDSSNYIDIYHNSISIIPRNILYGGDLFAGIMLMRGSNINVVNNNIANYNTRNAVYFARTNMVGICDYNNYYTPNGQVANVPNNSISPTAADTLHLNQWQALTGFDMHSTVNDPYFVYRDPTYSAALADLHINPNHPVVLTSAVYEPSVADDIDHQLRAGTPTIGADEYQACPDNARMLRLAPSTACPGVAPVTVKFQNVGTQTLSSLAIAWSVNGNQQPLYQWTGSVSMGDSAQVALGNYNFTTGSYTVTAICQLPNGQNDPFLYGDTVRQILTIYPSPLPALGPDQLLCPNRTVVISPGSFTSYLWSTGATTAAISCGAGIYYVTVTNSFGCPGMDTMTISALPVMPVTISGDSDLCIGESTCLTAGGALFYIWSTGSTNDSITASPATTTTYTVLATVSTGCQQTQTVHVSVHPLPIITITGNTDICTGANTTLTAGGANSYSWSSGSQLAVETVTPSTTTSYTVTGIDIYGCQDSLLQVVTVHPFPVIQVSGNDTICSGSSTVLTATGANNYSWSSGGTTNVETISAIASTNYTVIGTDNYNCADTATFTIHVNPLPVVSYMESLPILCANWNPAILTPGTPAGGWYSGPGVTGNTIDPAIAGPGTFAIIYSYTDAHSCIASDTSAVTIDLCTGGITDTSFTSFFVRPNPFVEVLIIDSPQRGTMMLYSADNRLVRKCQIAEGKNEIAMGDLPVGMYILVLQTEFDVAVKKVIRQN